MTGGKRPPHQKLCAGAFYLPTVVAGFSNKAGVWTADYQRAWRVAQRLEAGTVWINTYKQLSIATPFGGFKESGIGREKGIGGLRLYQQEKSLYFGLESPIRAYSSGV